MRGGFVDLRFGQMKGERAPTKIGVVELLAMSAEMFYKECNKSISVQI